MLLDDTIVALATPSGTGAIGIIRVSGINAIQISSKCFESHRGIDIINQSSHKTFLGWIKDGDRLIDKVLLTLFKGPNSYTGEDIVEISCMTNPHEETSEDKQTHIHSPHMYTVHRQVHAHSNN